MKITTQDSSSHKSEIHNLEEINNSLKEINHKTGWYWSALWRGMLSGFGYIIGAFIAVLAIGFALNVIGIIPAFTEQVDSFRDALQQAQNKEILPGE